MTEVALWGLVSLSLLAATAPGDAFDRAAGALDEGLRAEARDDWPVLRAAARILGATGASPVEGQDDAATRWRREAKGRAEPASRDRALGPGYRLLVLEPGAVAAFDQTFLAGQRARVAVAPAPTAVFALSVTEGESATPVCAPLPARKLCDWVPAYTQRFRIELTNRGSRPSQFYLLVQ